MNPGRPAEVCSALLRAIDAADGRRRSRKRDQTPDAIGLSVKRRILARVIAADPAPADFERWLMEEAAGAGDERDAGAVTAMARAVLDEWRMARCMPDFARWLDEGAPSEDALPSR